MIMFWATLLAVSILTYVLLDGFDLGIGMLFGVAASERRSHAMISAVAPIWDGNETWLVVSGVILWGAFPVVYSILMSAFYLPVLLMLAGLILRGVAFEFRSKAERLRWIWNASFAGGSLVAAFVQGLMVGALVEGLPLSDGPYAGGEFGWFSPFAVLCGIGLCVGYALLGACWLVQKCDHEIRDHAYRLIPYLSAALLVFLIVVFVYALAQDFAVMTRWLDRRSLFVFPVVGALAAITLAASVHRRHASVVAPFDGVITQRNVDVGSLVHGDANTGTFRFEIMQKDVIRVRVYVPQDAAFGVAPGVDAIVRVPELPDRAFSGKLTRISDALQSGTRTLLTEVDISNPDGALPPGIYCSFELKIPRKTPSFIAPGEALIFNRNGLQVAVVKDSKAKIRENRVKRDLGTQVEADTGLKGDEQVLLNPPATFVDGDRVQPRRAGASAA
jgi:cytochrome bd ubiquinol oxidase subunit II